MKNTRTFYSVTYGVWGANTKSEAWFDNLDEAKEFAAHDYRDNPVRHTYSNPDRIAEAEKIVQQQKEEA